MADAQTTKTPMGIQELLSRAATYGALLVCSAGFLWLVLFLNGAQTKNADDFKRDLVSVRDSVAKTREESAAFQADMRAELRALNQKLDRIESLLKKEEK